MTKERDDIGELGDDAKALLRSAQASGWDAPPSGAKERVRSALAIALAGTATAAAGSALGASTAKAAVAAKAATAATTGASAAGASTAAIGAASATAGAAGAAGSVAGAGLFSGLAAKVAIAAIAVSAVGGTIALTRPPSEAPRPVPVASSSAHHDEAPTRPWPEPAVVAPEPEAVPVLEPAGETITETVEVAPAEAARAPRMERAVPSPIVEATPEEAAPPSTLEDENAVLDRLHVAQARGDVDAVLGIIAEHRARFPRGRLSEEFSAAEVRTLCRSHDPRASELRAGFEERYPRSILLPSIATACR